MYCVSELIGPLRSIIVGFWCLESVWFLGFEGLGILDHRGSKCLTLLCEERSQGRHKFGVGFGHCFGLSSLHLSCLDTVPQKAQFAYSSFTAEPLA